MRQSFEGPHSNNEGEKFQFNHREETQPEEQGYGSLGDIDPGTLAYGGAETSTVSPSTEPTAAHSLADFELSSGQTIRPTTERAPESLEDFEIPQGQELERYVNEALWQQFAKDPEIQAALPGIKRLLANLVITGADSSLFSYAGEIPNAIVLVLKHWKTTNIFTPDVPAKGQWVAEGIDLALCGALPIPSHGIATYLQFKHDKPAILRAASRVREIMQSSRVSNQRTLTRNAADQFRQPPNHNEDRYE